MCEADRVSKGSSVSDAVPHAETIGDAESLADPDERNDDGIPDTNVELGTEEALAQAMTLDVAYNSLETIRKVNLSVEFGKEVDETQCVTCLRADHLTKVVRSKFGQWMATKAASPCLACGTPVCKSHRAPDFWKQNIVICVECAHLFSIRHGIRHLLHSDDTSATQNQINYMLEVYDRALLVLSYSMQFIDGVVAALEGNTSRHNKVGLGSSATGVVAGGLGVAAACTILTPVGPPLLLASMLFGGGATAVNAGSEAVNYRCEPNKMADRILTLHTLAGCIARLPAAMDKEEESEEVTLKQNAGNSSTLHWARTAMNGLKPLTAGALSALSIVTEARELKMTVDKIRAGNPCEKARHLQSIAKDIHMLPGTNSLADLLCEALDRARERPPAAETATPEEVDHAAD
eukprot:Nitzschia sp. Nitz4//scaffold191_size41780//19540//20757//NITZ4_007468-RA/size41780-processed-gene-0.81-mRNA-1//-1//CDS//3329540184//3781//frame0